MGQKTNPNGLRLGITHTWESKWFAKSKDVPALIKEDAYIRQYLTKEYKNAVVSQIEIERITVTGKPKVSITVYVANPGQTKASIKDASTDAKKKREPKDVLAYKLNKDVNIKIVPANRPEKVATLVAQNIAKQLESRASFRRVQKIAIQRALKAGAKGVKTNVSGRLGGAEMARSEGYSEGRVPLHTLRADVDYATAEAKTTYGILGVKVWIYHGEVLPGQSILDTRKPFDRSQAGKRPFDPNRPRRPQTADGQNPNPRPRRPQPTDASKGGN